MAGAKLYSDHVFSILDPESLILSQFADTKNPNYLHLTTDTFIMERGPRYKAYSDLRESKLRSKSISHPPPLPPKVSTPPQLQKVPTNRLKGSFVLAQSVPDFTYALRKENRKPTLLPTVVEKSATPPAKNSSRLYEINAKTLGSKSSVSSEKKSGGNGALTARKSYANMDELKKFSMAAANAINGENRGGKVAGNRGGGSRRRTTVLGSRQFY